MRFRFWFLFPIDIPEFFKNTAKLKKYVDDTKSAEGKNYFGVQKKIVLEKLPIFKPLFENTVRRVNSKRSNEEIQDIVEERVHSKHLYSYSERLPTIIGQYVRFCMAGMQSITLDIFLCAPLIHSFFKFCELWNCAPSTKRNNALAFRNILKFFQTYDASKNYTTKINNLLNELSIMCKVRLLDMLIYCRLTKIKFKKIRAKKVWKI